MPWHITINGRACEPPVSSKEDALKACRKKGLTEWTERAGFRLERLKEGVEIVHAPTVEVPA